MRGVRCTLKVLPWWRRPVASTATVWRAKRPAWNLAAVNPLTPVTWRAARHVTDDWLAVQLTINAVRSLLLGQLIFLINWIIQLNNSISYLNWIIQLNNFIIELNNFIIELNNWIEQLKWIIELNWIFLPNDWKMLS